MKRFNFFRTSRTSRRLLLAALAATSLASCANINYYSQAAQGQIALLSESRPIDDWLADPGTKPNLRTRLARARQIRLYAVQQLGLPDNQSYKNYTALNRP